MPPIDRVLTIHASVHMMSVIYKDIMDFSNTVINTFPPLPLIYEENWERDFNKLYHQLKNFMDEKNHRSTRINLIDQAVLQEFLNNNMKKNLTDEEVKIGGSTVYKNMVDANNDTIIKLKQANSYIDGAELQMLECLESSFSLMESVVKQFCEKLKGQSDSDYIPAYESKWRNFKEKHETDLKNKIINTLINCSFEDSVDSIARQEITEGYLKELRDFESKRFGKKFLECSNDAVSIAHFIIESGLNQQEMNDLFEFKIKQSIFRQLIKDRNAQLLSPTDEIYPDDPDAASADNELIVGGYNEAAVKEAIRKVLRQTHGGKEVVRYQTDWFGFYAYLRDHDMLIDDNRTSFVNLMNKWFPKNDPLPNSNSLDNLVSNNRTLDRPINKWPNRGKLFNRLQLVISYFEDEMEEIEGK